MRSKDYKKKKAIFQATVKLVNDIGISSSTVARIAREAGVSVGTLYLYYKNKEDIIVSAFLKIKRKMSKALFRGVSETMTLHATLHRVWQNMFLYAKANLNEVCFTELVSKSEYITRIEKQKTDLVVKPLSDVIQKGIQDKSLKNVHSDIMVSFLLFPVMGLVNPNLNRDLELDEKQMDAAFQLAWDAIKI